MVDSWEGRGGQWGVEEVIRANFPENNRENQEFRASGTTRRTKSI